MWNNPEIDEAILAAYNELSGEDKDSLLQQSFDIWDKVKLISDTKNKIYVIYSYTVYKWDRIVYTIWVDDEYESVEPWQIEQYYPKEPIWFNKTIIWNTEI